MSDYGKFASAEELLKGYNELEKSFTQKCQQLALAEKEKTELKVAQSTNEHSTVQQASGTSAEASPHSESVQSTTVDSAATVPQNRENASETVLHGLASDSDIVASDETALKTEPFAPTERQLQQYFAEHPELIGKILQPASMEAPKVMSGGGNVSLALPSRPKTIKEASVMAKELFR